MTGQQWWPTIRPQASLPPGLRVAGMGVRLGAWLIDSLILGLVFVGIVLVAAAAGAIGINPEAERQLESAPGAIPTVAPYTASLPLLAVFAVLLVLVNVGYATVLVARFRGLPGQLMLSLQVGDAATGRNLSPRRALLRAVLSIGIPSAGAAGFLYSIVALESSVPWSEVANPQTGGAAETWLASWAGPILVAMVAFFVWPVALLLWTATSSTRQGLHDVAARSQVVGRAPMLLGYGYSAGQMPGYPPGELPPGFVPPGAQPFGSPPYGAWPVVNQPAAGAPGDPDAPGAPGAPQIPDEPPALDGSEPQMPRPGGQGPPLPGGWLGRYRKAADSGKLPDRTPFWPRSGGETDTPGKVRGATIGRRTAAYLVDSVVVYMLFSLIQTILLVTVLKSVAPADSSQAVFDERTSILVGLLGGLLQMVYFVPVWVIWRGTMAQRLMHLEVADATTGRALGWMDAFLRWAVLQGPMALVTIVPQVARGPMVFVATAWVFYLHYSTQTNRDWQGLHDRFANSRVAQEL
jgi:uncharacterized RDD family membrane protein YckC